MAFAYVSCSCEIIFGKICQYELGLTTSNFGDTDCYQSTGFCCYTVGFYPQASQILKHLSNVVTNIYIYIYM